MTFVSTSARGSGGGSSSFHGCLVYRSTGNVNGLQTFDTEVYDTDAFHSTVSNTSRMTIPAGYTNAKWRATAYGRFGTAAVGLDAYFLVNGAVYGGRAWEFFSTGGHFSAANITMPIQASAGDYIEVAMEGDTVTGGAWGTANCPIFAVELIGT